MLLLLPVLIILEALLWMFKVDAPGDTVWLQWLWLTFGVYLLLSGGFVTAVRTRVVRQ